MEKRIRKVLMICTSFDAYNLEEDGQIEAKLYREYIDLNISNPPSLTWVTTPLEAEELITDNNSFDLIISMFNTADLDIFNLSKNLKEKGIYIPLVLLVNFSKEVIKRLEHEDKSSVDYIFSWNGNTDLILAIIKLIEDKMNADKDILEMGVQSILLVEDSIRYYSTYLPAIYKLILQQSAEFLKDTINERELKVRKRARPKILMATNYKEAEELYNKYKDNLLGVISDIGFVMDKNDPPEKENLEAGILLATNIKRDNTYMPILLQSSQESLRDKAIEIGCGFLVKYSVALLMELSDYISEEFVFGDFIFRDLNTKEVLAKATDIRSMQVALNEIPEEVLLYHTSRNRLSKWLYSRGLFGLAKQFKNIKREDFDSFSNMRDFIIAAFRDFRMALGQSGLAMFNDSNYTKYTWLAKLGEGSLGGKARGLAFLNNLLQKYNLRDKYKGVKVMIPRTIVIATDYFEQFITTNGLQYVINSNATDDEILSEFVSSRLPEKLSVELRTYLETVTTPLAVRSSSKLEDSLFQPFAGIYSTYMIPVTKNKDQMLRLLSKAIKSVYASVFYSSSKAYIHTTANLLGEEKMAVVIQDICGTEDNGYFFPTFSGVARSINFYPIMDEKPEDGIVSIGYGLGKLIVDGEQGLKFNPKYPKKVLQLSTTKMALSDTQSCMYALDLEPDQFKTSINDSINIKKFTIQQASKFRNIKHVASTWDMNNQRIVHNTFDEKGWRIITFAHILEFDKFPLAEIIKDLMDICVAELRCPVEIEFAVNMDVKKGEDYIFNALQVRPITTKEDESNNIDLSTIDISQALITSNNAIGPGVINNITDIIYVKPETFNKLKTHDIALEVGKLNKIVKESKGSTLLIGPGRWGSSNQWLGIPISWADISEAKAIIEYGLPDFPVEPSQGTHFFQNITSLGVGYLTVSPYLKEGLLDFDKLEKLNVTEELQYVKLIKLDKSPTIYINGSESKGIVIL